MSYRCGQCGSRSLYRNDDPVNSVAYIACIICGNRWPGGMAPVKTGESGKEPEGAEDMNKRGNCLNCDRERNLIAGLCHTCWQSAKGMTGEAREKALAATKARIEAGSARLDEQERKRGGSRQEETPNPRAPKSGGPMSQEAWLMEVDAAPAIPEVPSSCPAPAASGYVLKHRTCTNCGRTMLLKARGLCGGCYTVWQRCTSRGYDPETLARELKTAATRFRQGPEATRSYMSAQAIAAKVRKSFSEKAQRDQAAREALAIEQAKAARRFADAVPAPAIPANPDHPTPEGPVMAGIDINPGLIMLRFGERDKDLLEFLRSDATRLRRTPDQQILWILEAHMQAMVNFGVAPDGQTAKEG